MKNGISKIKNINDRVSARKNKANGISSDNSVSELSTMDMWADQEDDTDEDRLEKADYRASATASNELDNQAEKEYFDKVRTRYIPVAKHVNEYRRVLSTEFTTVEELTDLLSATYEVVGKKYFEAKRRKDEFATTEWIKIIKTMPDLVIPNSELPEAVVKSNEDLIRFVEGEVRTPKDAVSLLFAISLEIDDIIHSEGSDEGVDSIVDDVYTAFDEKFNNMR